MSKWLKILIVTILVIIIGVAVYFLPRPNYNVTGKTWATSMWGEVEVPPSFAKFENGIFNATVSQPSRDFFGASLIQQGDSPHSWWNLTAKLREEITYNRAIADAQPALVIDFIGKRTSPIEWFDSNQSNRANNIGILLVGDVGLGYYNPDNSTPRALFIDIWLDNNPTFTAPVHWQGVKNVENDYHSGFPEKTMPKVGKEYQFTFRADNFIMDSLKYWKLEQFTLKMVQFYIEAKASKASIEVRRLLITT